MQIYLVRIFLHPVIFTTVDFALIILLHSLLSHKKWNTEIIFGSIQVYFIFCNICNKKKTDMHSHKMKIPFRHLITTGISD